MELSDYVRILRKRWRLIMSVALAGVIVASGFVLTATKEYAASARLFVSTQNTADASLTAAVQGSNFSEARVTSYAQLMNTPPVMQEVITRLGLSTTPLELGTHVSATAPLNSVLLNVNVTDTSPQRAALLANATASAFIDVATALEKPADGSPSPVRLTVVKQASVPLAPSSPSKKLDLGLGLLVGLLLGLAGAVLRDNLDTSVKRSEEMAELTGAATLAVIGFDPEVASTPLVVDGSPHAPRAEALRQLRTNLQFVDVDHPPRSVLVTSAVPKEGKSSTTTNLALTLARGGKRVILVEGDLRRPRVASYLGLPGNLPGITDLLVGSATLDQALTPFRDERLQVLSSGAAPPNPSELLGSTAMRELIRQLEERADIVLIDAPPLLPVTDGAVLASIADGVIFVIRAGRTRREQVTRAIESLRAVDAQLLGCVLSMASAKGPEAYGYGYGYDYTNDADAGRRWFSRRARPVAVAGEPVVGEPVAGEPVAGDAAATPPAPAGPAVVPAVPKVAVPEPLVAAERELVAASVPSQGLGAADQARGDALARLRGMSSTLSGPPAR